MIPDETLIAATQQAFGFLPERGYEGMSVRLVSPESFRGGFTVTYTASDSRIVVSYLEMELTVSKDEEELFGASRRGSFAGNMFSRENLLKCLDRIAAQVEQALDS